MIFHRFFNNFVAEIELFGYAKGEVCQLWLASGTNNSIFVFTRLRNLYQHLTPNT